MGIEWFRDLSITVLAFVTTAVLVFAAILFYRLYRTLKSTLFLVKATAQIAHDTVALIQEGIKPILSLLALIQGLRGGIENIGKMFKKESDEGEIRNE